MKVRVRLTDFFPFCVFRNSMFNLKTKIQRNSLEKSKKRLRDEFMSKVYTYLHFGFDDKYEHVSIMYERIQYY